MSATATKKTTSHAHTSAAAVIAPPQTQTQPHRSRSRVTSNAKIAIAFGVLTFVLRIAFSADQPTEWDSIHYVRAISHFDVVQYWPHAPGYWLFVFLGRVVHWLTPLSAYQSLLVLTATMSAATISFAYFVGLRVGGRRFGIVASCVLMTLPFMWFYGSMVGTRSFDALLLMALLLLALRAQPRSSDALWACLLIGFAGGVRQSAAVIYLPLVLYVMARSIRSTRSVRMLIGCIAATTAAGAAWFVPMVSEQPGGLSPIREESNHLLRGSLEATSILVGAPGAKSNMLEVAGISYTALLPIVPLMLVCTICAVATRRHDVPKTVFWIPLTLAALPGLAEATLIHLGTPGYTLSFIPGIVLAMLFPLRYAKQNTTVTLAVVAATVAVCAYQTQRFVDAPYVLPAKAMELSGFLEEGKYGAPYNQNYAGIRALDADQLRYREIRNFFDPTKDVLILSNQNGGHRYRYLGYQLPEFTAHLINEGNDIDQARNGRHSTIADQVIEVAPGGRAIVVPDVESEEIKALLAKGAATSVVLPSGPTIYAVDSGNTVFGVRLVTAPLPAI